MTESNRPKTFDDRLTRLIDYAGERRLSLTLLMFLFGFVMVMLSNLIGIGSVSFNGTLKSGTDVLAGVTGPDGKPVVHYAKDVGYFLALNWSMLGSVLTPLIVWYGIGALHAMQTTLRDLESHGMLRDAAFQRLESGAVNALWGRYARQNRLLFLAVFLCVIFYVMTDWWHTVGWPLLHPAQVHNLVSDASMEYDWSVASLFAQVDTAALFLFGLVDYVVLSGFVPALALAVIISALHFVVFITGTAMPRASFALAAMPDKGGHDHLCGFSSFAVLFNNLLLGSICVQLSLWLVSVQNAYLRDTNPKHVTILTFLLGDVDKAVGLVRGHLSFEEFEDWIGNANGALTSNIQVIMAMTLVPFIIVTAVGLCCYLLRDHADKARKLSLAHLDVLVAETGHSRRTLKKALDQMQVWPVAWVKEHDVIFLMVILFASLLSYRLMLLALIFGLYKIFEHFREKLQSGTKSGHKGG